MKNHTGLPLSPYKFLDLTDEKGFLCGKILADLGADVIKVEKPGGDFSRNIGPFYKDNIHPEKSLYWFAYNTSKRGITLDIESRDGQAIFRRLVEKSDGVIESFEPGYLQKLGMDYDVLNAINPQIILTSITPFGQKSAYSIYKASELTIQAISGMMNVCGEYNSSCLMIGGAESRQTYLQAGASAAVATSLALWGRHGTGRGQHIDVAAAECAFWAAFGPRGVLNWELEEHLLTRHGQKTNYGHPANFQNVYRCQDGYIFSEVFVGGGQGHYTQRLVEWMDSEGMAQDLKAVNWLEIDAREVTQNELDHWEDVVTRFFLSHTRAELRTEAINRGVLLFPVNEPNELVDNAQLKSRAFFVEVSHPELGDAWLYPGSPYRSAIGQPKIRFRAPLIGEHNEDVYGELGISEQELLILKQNGVI